MKIAHISIAALAGVSLLCTSCVVGPYDGYGTFSYSTNGYSSTVAWTSASYDANGFPIYGYSYGRPVYGYTATGAAIFTIGALTALCFVPDWGPAPWYRGHWHYPPHIHRAPAPPHHAPDHHPDMRPPGGMHAPIHKNPHSVLGKPAPHKPAHHEAPAQQHRPNVGNKPGNDHRPAVNNRPNAGNRPGNDHRPAANNRPNVGNRPGNINRPAINHQPSTGNRPANINRPSVSRPVHASRPAVSNRPNISRPNVSSRPSVNTNRIGSSSRPAGFSGHSRSSSGGSHRSGSRGIHR